MQTHEGYLRDTRKMLAATRAWRDQNPEVKLVFRPIGVQDGIEVIAGLTRSIIRRVGGSAKTRELLKVMDVSIHNQGTITMAEECIEQVFGIRRALTVRSEGSKPSGLQPAEPRTTILMAASPCTGCGAPMNAATHLDGVAIPGPGDFTVCAHCGEVLRFDENLRVRATTPAEREGMPQEMRDMVELFASGAWARFHEIKA